MKVVVETKRLLLREVLESDANGFFELDSDPEVHKYLGNRPIKTILEAESIIRHVRRQYNDNGIGRWAIEEKATGRFVGWTGLKLEKQNINNQPDYYDLGYRLIPKFWGLGMATESAIASLRYGFTEMRLPVIHSAAHVENVASNVILKKLGFRFQKTFEYDSSKHNWYSIEKAEYEVHQIQ